MLTPRSAPALPVHGMLPPFKEGGLPCWSGKYRGASIIVNSARPTGRDSIVMCVVRAPGYQSTNVILRATLMPRTEGGPLHEITGHQNWCACQRFYAQFSSN